MGLTPMYASNGITITNTSAVCLWDEEDTWGSMILALRQQVVVYRSQIGMTPPVWTRDDSTLTEPGEYFYVSHVTNLRGNIEAMNIQLSRPAVVWTTPTGNIAPRYNFDGSVALDTGYTDARDVRIINEIIDALDSIGVYLGVVGNTTPINARVTVLGVEVGS